MLLLKLLFVLLICVLYAIILIENTKLHKRIQELKSENSYLRGNMDRVYYHIKHGLNYLNELHIPKND